MVELMRYFGLSGMATILLASPVFAHAFLERASPPVGGEVAVSPPQIALTFTEGVEPSFSTIEIHDSQGTLVVTDKPRTVSDDSRKLVVDVPMLHTGKYTVIWHVTSVDTHKTEGRFQFTVAP
jgi:methionine-rich copper-binding protein CopC